MRFSFKRFLFSRRFSRPRQANTGATDHFGCFPERGRRGPIVAHRGRKIADEVMVSQFVVGKLATIQPNTHFLGYENEGTRRRKAEISPLLQQIFRYWLMKLPV